MEIHTKELTRVTIVELKGRVDHEASADLKRALSELFNLRKYNIVVDLSGVDYINSSGLRALLVAHKETHGKHHGDVRLAAPTTQVSDTLKLVGFDKVFKIYPNLVDAVGSF